MLAGERGVELLAGQQPAIDQQPAELAGHGVRSPLSPEIEILAERHGLSDAWARFKTRFLDD